MGNYDLYPIIGVPHASPEYTFRQWCVDNPPTHNAILQFLPALNIDNSYTPWFRGQLLWLGARPCAVIVFRSLSKARQLLLREACAGAVDRRRLPSAPGQHRTVYTPAHCFWAPPGWLEYNDVLEALLW